MFLARHAFDGGALLVPDGRDVEKHVRRPSALLRLMRLKEKYGRRAENLLAGLVTVRLRDDPRVLGKFGHQLMVAIIDVAARVGEDEGRADPAVEIDEAVERRLIERNRIVAEIPKLDVGDAEDSGGRFRFPAAFSLDLFERHAALAPELGRLAALAIGEANDGHRHSASAMQGDRAAGAPDEIRGMGADDKACRACHINLPLGVSPLFYSPSNGGVPWV